jgi:hypothetical protein
VKPPRGESDQDISAANGGSRDGTAGSGKVADRSSAEVDPSNQLGNDRRLSAQEPAPGRSESTVNPSANLGKDSDVGLPTRNHVHQTDRPGADRRQVVDVDSYKILADLHPSAQGPGQQHFRSYGVRRDRDRLAARADEAGEMPPGRKSPRGSGRTVVANVLQESLERR